VDASCSPTSLVSIHLLIHLSSHLSHHPCSRHPSLLHSFTRGSKPTFSTNPSHLRFLVPTGLPHDNGTYHAHDFSFSFTFYFLFIPCGRLSWLPVSLSLHVKYTLSYRIVSYSRWNTSHVIFRPCLSVRDIAVVGDCRLIGSAFNWNTAMTRVIDWP